MPGGAAEKDSGGDGLEVSPSGLPIKPIPGSHGIPFFSALRDRFDFYYLPPAPAGFFRSRIASAGGSTVLRLNVPPGPFLARDPRVVAVLDALSFRVLLDSSLVDKSDTLTGTYLPSLSLYGGFRPLAYLDTSDPLHATLKHLISSLLASRKHLFIPAFRSSYCALFDSLESSLESSPSADADAPAAAAAGAAEFNKLNESASFEFTCAALLGEKPEQLLGPTGHVKALKWLFFQLHPLVVLGGPLPRPVEDLLLHTFHLPPALVRDDYGALKDFFARSGAKFLDEASGAGVSRDEALHNLIFAAIFNAYGGLKIFFPVIMKWLARSGAELHARLAEEVRAAVRAEGEGGEVTATALERMELVKSVVWECLRIDPPVAYQYGRARKDLVIESHDAAYKVDKGEMIFGYQPFATRDERVFHNGSEFVADRFVGEEGRRLLDYVVWSNGAETAQAGPGNKQCPGKDLVVLAGRLFVVELFLRYDTLAADVGTLPLEPKITVNALTPATTGK